MRFHQSTLILHDKTHRAKNASSFAAFSSREDRAKRFDARDAFPILPSAKERPTPPAFISRAPPLHFGHHQLKI
jgi:hypothetical protein